jgi:hypothetical protein
MAEEGSSVNFATEEERLQDCRACGCRACLADLTKAVLDQWESHEVTSNEAFWLIRALYPKDAA